ncbi:hypothetical protein DFQ29_003725, partial [Apophysomyces sp. BC1021]
NLVDVWNYCIKEDQSPLANMDPPQNNDNNNRDKRYLAIMDESTTRDEFIERCRREFPRDFMLFMDRFNAYANTFFTEPEPVYTPNDQFPFAVPNILSEWVYDNLTN